MTSGSLASHDRRPVALTYHKQRPFPIGAVVPLFQIYSPTRTEFRGGGGHRDNDLSLFRIIQGKVFKGPDARNMNSSNHATRPGCTGFNYAFDYYL